MWLYQYGNLGIFGGKTGRSVSYTHLFIREEDDLYRRYQETHFERAWSLDEIKKALTEAGMDFVAAYDAFTKNAPRKESDRIYVVAREHGKEV